MTVRRLFVICEGQTEETFAGTTLAAHLSGTIGVTVRPLLLLNKRGYSARTFKGGLSEYPKAKDFLRHVMAEHHSDETWFTTMFDLYGLPGDFPGLDTAPAAPPSARVRHLETALHQDIVSDALWRFTPYFQLHEFEALVLAEPERLGEFILGRDREVGQLISSLGNAAPEDVNERPQSAPSKRIIQFIPEYEGLKTVAGPLVAESIGLPRLRERCPHFAEWLSELEKRCTS